MEGSYRIQGTRCARGHMADMSSHLTCWATEQAPWYRPLFNKLGDWIFRLLSSHSKTVQSGWLIKKQNPLLPVLVAGSLRSACTVVRTPSWPTGGRGVPFMKSLALFYESSVLMTFLPSQGSHLHLPSVWGPCFNIWICGIQNFIQYSQESQK